MKKKLILKKKFFKNFSIFIESVLKMHCYKEEILWKTKKKQLYASLLSMTWKRQNQARRHCSKILTFLWKKQLRQGNSFVDLCSGIVSSVNLHKKLDLMQTRWKWMSLLRRQNEQKRWFLGKKFQSKNLWLKVVFDL